jgi:hypothetical protein
MRSALAGGWLLGVPIAGLMALGSAWLLDRSRPWEAACWRTDRFVLVGGRPDSAYRGERWVVAVQPDCPHCMAMAPVIADSARRLGVRVAALIVDCRSAPDPTRLGTLRVDELWWDSGNVWRRRWGHRVYGELLRFDAAGVLIDPAQAPREPHDPRQPQSRDPKGGDDE